MTSERWELVKRLFHQAAERDVAERASFLAKACGGDEDLRAEVASLVATDERAATLLDGSVTEILEEALGAAPTETGRRFGVYRVVSEIGRGGMAVVYSAVRDDDQYEKEVAIKLIKRGMDSDSIVARFRQERQILAHLEHPSIARLIDGGVSEDGLPYLVMERVEGVPIDVYCERRGLGIEERLELFLTVAATVQYAHRNLVVHRDLKPSNILVTDEGDAAPGRVKLLDFGIAKLLEAEPGDDPATIAGPRPLTPEYASPEQVRGEPVTAATDVYALGVLLYQLVAGRRPYRLRSLSPREVERVICDEEPILPSAAAGREGASEIEARRLRRKLAGDLDNVVMKAMHKVPERRYGSAEQLAEDLRRYREGLPIRARKDTLAYRAGKFLIRHRWGLAATLLIFLSLVSGIVATTMQAAAAREQREVAERVAEFMVGVFEISHPGQARGETITARHLLDQADATIARGLEEQPEMRASLMDSMGLAFFKLGLYDQAAVRLRQALELRLETLGEDHPASIVSKNHLGRLHTVRGDYREAERLHREALRAALDRFAAEDEVVAESRNRLAMALYHQDRLDEAEALLRDALALRRRRPGELREEAANLSELALVVKARGGYREAESLLREALSMNRWSLGDEHPEVAVNLNNLAEVLRDQGRCEEAIGLFEEALALETRILDEKHTDLADTRNNLAGCLKDLGRYERAEELYRTSLEGWREALGERHPSVANGLNNLGQIYYLEDDLEVAAEHFRRALAIYREAHRGPHADVATTLNNLAAVWSSLGDPAAAEAAYREALSIHLELLGPKSLAAATDRFNLAMALKSFPGRLDEAEDQLRTALEVRREVLGEAHRDVVDSLWQLGLLYRRSGRMELARSPLEESLRIRRERYPEETNMIASTRSELGACLTALGDYERAEAMLRAGYATFLERFGEDNWRTVITRERLVDLYRAWGRPAKAADLDSVLIRRNPPSP